MARTRWTRGTDDEMTRMSEESEARMNDPMSHEGGGGRVVRREGDRGSDAGTSGRDSETRRQ
eukprot:3071087-Pyramimonas_sp.AAC.1